MSTAQVPDQWMNGDAYELFVGRWSSKVAVEFLEWLDAPEHLRWVDVGCGTGALSASILEYSAPSLLSSVEPSPAFARAAADRLGDRATVQVAPAESLPLGAGSADVVVSGLVLNFIQDLPAALAEMCRVAPAGLIAAYVWDYSGRMDFIRLFWEAAVAVSPGGVADEASRFPLCNPDALLAAFTAAGMVDAEVRAIDVPTRFENFDELWAPFTGGQGSGPSYLASLDQPNRELVRENMRHRVPTAPDGSIDLIARAWAIRATAS